MITVEELIKKLQKFSTAKQKLPIVMKCENGLLAQLNIKYMVKDIGKPLDCSTENIKQFVITWE